MLKKDNSLALAIITSVISFIAIIITSIILKNFWVHSIYKHALNSFFIAGIVLSFLAITVCMWQSFLYNKAQKKIKNLSPVLREAFYKKQVISIKNTVYFIFLIILFIVLALLISYILHSQITFFGLLAWGVQGYSFGFFSSIVFPILMLISGILAFSFKRTKHLLAMQGIAYEKE